MLFCLHFHFRYVSLFTEIVLNPPTKKKEKKRNQENDSIVYFTSSRFLKYAFFLLPAPNAFTEPYVRVFKDSERCHPD